MRLRRKGIYVMSCCRVVCGGVAVRWCGGVAWRCGGVVCWMMNTNYVSTIDSLVDNHQENVCSCHIPYA